jgi:peptide/nickel transport system ATP-binding protein
MRRPSADVEPLLSVRGLRVTFATRDGLVQAVRGVSFELGRGEVLGVVGESGSGKTVSALALLRLLPPENTRIEGEVVFDGQSLLDLSPAALRRVRGARIGMIFQDPLSSLDPVRTIGAQLCETLRVHHRISGPASRARALELLDSVGIPDPARCLHAYPHELSGGMRQRAMIAMAVGLRPDLLIADEPTTALDVTVQAQIIELLHRIRAEYGLAMIVITHDLALTARVCDRLLVMYAGQIVEAGTITEVLGRPRHPYTQGLLRAAVRLDRPRSGRLTPIEGPAPDPTQIPAGCPFRPRCPHAIEACLTDPPLERVSHFQSVACWVKPPWRDGEGQIQPAPARASEPSALEVLLQVEGLTVTYPIDGGPLLRPRAWLRAVDEVDIAIARGTTLGLVGESGSGKTSLARAIMLAVRPTRGRVVFGGTDLTALPARALRSFRRRFQMVFQDPYASLDPRQLVGDAIAEPLRFHQLIHPSAVQDRVEELLELVGLDPRLARRSPHELSGGQRQRVAIARALALEPELVVCDEPISSLDVSVQAQIINLLRELQQRLRLTYLFISHDVSVVRHLSDEVAVMYLGRVVERGPVEQVCSEPMHPYTAALLSAVPVPDPARERARKRIILEGDIPSPLDPPRGCRFQSRCWLRRALGNPDRCETEEPMLASIGTGRFVACHYADAMDQSGRSSIRGLQT